jgi:hypothetical protein
MSCLIVRVERYSGIHTHMSASVEYLLPSMHMETSKILVEPCSFRELQGSLCPTDNDDKEHILTIGQP